MIDFKALEFFFAKSETHQVDIALKSVTPARKRVASAQTPNQVRPMHATTAAILPKASMQSTKTILPPKKKPASFKKNEPSKKDGFYAQWEKKYKDLNCQNLLAKDEFRRFVLFVIKKNDSKAFAEKIFSAVSSRLMDGELVIQSGTLKNLIEKHRPTHLVTTFEVDTPLSISVITIKSLLEVENSPGKKKDLWETLKKVLKE